jgi:hypothetical protein
MPVNGRMGRDFRAEDCRGLKRGGKDRQWNCLNKGVPQCNLGTREFEKLSD